MTAPTGRARSAAALASAACTLLAIWAISPAGAQTSDPSWDGSQFGAPAAGDTSTDRAFSGTFMHKPAVPTIATVDLTVGFAASDNHNANCAPAPGKQPTQHFGSSTTSTSINPSTSTSIETTTSNTTPSDTSTANFRFNVTFTCNGIYDATATATLESPSSLTHDLQLQNVRVALPPDRPASFLATDNGNNTVTLTWSPPSSAPPDLAGYRLSRADAAAGSTFATLGPTTTPDVFTFTDTNIPAGGGSYRYQIETLRKAPPPTTVIASAPFMTDALVVDSTTGSVPGNNGGGGGGSSGGGGGGQTSGSGGTGVQHFDQEEELAADEGELGAGDPLAAFPGGSTVQRFAGRAGAGLITPFAAALDLAVWAGLLLFLTRRAASAERGAALTVELEHPS